MTVFCHNLIRQDFRSRDANIRQEIALSSAMTEIGYECVSPIRDSYLGGLTPRDFRVLILINSTQKAEKFVP